MTAWSFTPAEIAALEAWADPTVRRAAPDDLQRFRRALAGGVARLPADVEVSMQKWAEAMRAAGTLGTTEAGRALARHLNLATETR